MLVRKAERIDVECVVRGYISGSGWLDYQKTGEISGIKLMEGLEESQELLRAHLHADDQGRTRATTCPSPSSRSSTWPAPAPRTR